MPQGNPEGYIQPVPDAETRAGPNPMTGPRPGATDGNGDGMMSDVEKRFRDLPPDMRQLLLARMDPELATILMMLMPDLTPLLTRAMSATPDMVQAPPVTPGAGPQMAGGIPSGPGVPPAGGLQAIRA